MDAVIDTPPDINSPTGVCDRCGETVFEEHLIPRGRFPSFIGVAAFLCPAVDPSRGSAEGGRAPAPGTGTFS